MKTITATFSFFFFTILGFGQSNEPGSGHALYFDGVSNNYVDCGDNLNNIDVPFTVSAWIWIEKNAGPKGIIVTDNGLGNYMGIQFKVHANNNKKLVVSYGDGGGIAPAFRRTLVSIDDMPEERWVHVVGIMTGPTTGKLYLNGQEIPHVTSGSGGPMVHNNRPLVIGKRTNPLNGNQYKFKGHIDEVRVWNYALSEKEIRGNMCKKLTGNEPGLMGYWRFDEGAGTVAEDSSPNQFHGTLF